MYLRQLKRETLKREISYITNSEVELEHFIRKGSSKYGFRVVKRNEKDEFEAMQCRLYKKLQVGTGRID